MNSDLFIYICEREQLFFVNVGIFVGGIAEMLSPVHIIICIPSCASSDIVCFGHYRDVQASSILLDDKFEVRLGSLSDVCAQEGDTHQSRITRLLRLPQ